MKKLVISLFLGLILYGCSPTDRQIQEAIELTETAIPTYTSTTLATSTATSTPTVTLIPTKTASPIPDVSHIEGLSNQDVLFMFLENGFTCGEWELNEEGNYEQSCISSALSGVPDSTIIGRIYGRSEDTVFGYFIVFTPHISFESWDQLEVLLKNIVDYGKEPEENIAWINDLFMYAKDSEDFVETREYFDVNIVFSSESSVISLLIVSSELRFKY